MSLLQVTKRTPSRLFSFMNPLAVEIWLSLLGAYVMVSLTIWIVARFSPYEWVEPSPCPSCNCPLQVGTRRVVRNNSDCVIRCLNKFSNIANINRYEANIFQYNFHLKVILMLQLFLRAISLLILALTYYIKEILYQLNNRYNYLINKGWLINNIYGNIF